MPFVCSPRASGVTNRARLVAPALLLLSAASTLLRGADAGRPVVLLGDSLISRPYNEFALSSRITARLPADAISIVNAGVSSQKIAAISARTPAVLAVNAPWAVLLFWDSDVSDVDEAALSAATVTELRANYSTALNCTLAAIVASGALVAVAGPGILGEGPLGLPTRWQNKATMLDAYRGLTRGAAEAAAVPYFDMRAAFLQAIPRLWPLSSGAVTVDGEHPNAAGTDIEARLFAAQIDAWLQLQPADAPTTTPPAPASASASASAAAGAGASASASASLSASPAALATSGADGAADSVATSAAPVAEGAEAAAAPAGAIFGAVTGVAYALAIVAAALVLVLRHRRARATPAAPIEASVNALRGGGPRPSSPAPPQQRLPARESA